MEEMLLGGRRFSGVDGIMDLLTPGSEYVIYIYRMLFSSHKEKTFLYDLGICN